MACGHYLTKKITLGTVFTVSILLLVVYFLQTAKLLTRHHEVSTVSANATRYATPSTQREDTSLTIVCNIGRLGNQMFTYATLYGVARYNHRKPLGPACNIEQLQKFFKISMESASPSIFSSFHIRRAFTVSVKNLVVPPNEHLIQVQGYYPVSFRHFERVLKEVLEEFRFRDPLLEYADSVLLAARGKRSEVTFVGIHVRRGDFDSHLCRFKAKTEASPVFYRKAMDIFRRKFADAMFLVTSDTPKWAREYVRGDDVRFVGDMTRDPAFDLAVLSRCNHTIFAYGTFGTWAAMLAGGQAIYLADLFRINPHILTKELTEKDMYLPEWTGIENGSWDVNCKLCHAKKKC